jgi:amino acid adenylation domain-containing protein
VAQGLAENVDGGAGADDLAYVIYTSGSTGLSKGCLTTHRNLTRLFAATANRFNFCANDVWTLFHSCAFDFSVWEIWGALLYGGRLVIVPYETSRNPAEFLRLLSTQQVTVLNQTPSAFRQLTDAERSTPPQPLFLRWVIFGGEALDPSMLVPWFERHSDQQPQLVNMYGITETTVHVTFHALNVASTQGRDRMIGQPIGDLRAYILDEALQPQPIGIPGELCIAGAGLARGYLNRPELTAERFIEIDILGRRERIYRSGDLARWRLGGNLEFLGRLDHQVKIRGFRIEPGEIEAALSAQAGVQEAVILAREDQPGEPRLVAYLRFEQPAETEQPGNAEGLEADFLAHWQQLYEDLYGSACAECVFRPIVTTDSA